MMNNFDAIFAHLGKHERIAVAELVNRIDAKLARRDAMADWMVILLEQRIIQLIRKEIANAKTGNL